MIIIAAMTHDGLIGKGGSLPWNIPEEYEQYRTFIRNQTLLIGRKSYEIFGPDNTSAHTVVLSRTMKPTPGIHVCRSFNRGLELARSFGCPVFCAGGAAVYQEALPHAEALYLSFIKGSYSGDTFFPTFDVSQWQIQEARAHDTFVFRRYVRKGKRSDNRFEPHTPESF